MTDAKNKQSSNTKLLLIIGGATVAFILILCAVLFVAPLFKKNIHQMENQRAADKVIDMIATLDEKEISLDSEDELALIKEEYDTLTNEQKLLVTNYATLEESYLALQSAQDAFLAQALIEKIEAIDKDTLTSKDTQVAALKAEYEALSEEQKKLVTNRSLLEDYQAIIDKKIKAEKKIEVGKALAETFEGYSGKWGNFGAHNNKYQGMIETAIKNKIRFKDYFSCAPNDLDMTVSRFEKNESIFGIGISHVYFRGPAKDDYIDVSMCVYGEVIIKEDGSVYYNVLSSEYYNGHRY